MRTLSGSIFSVTVKKKKNKKKKGGGGGKETDRQTETLRGTDRDTERQMDRQTDRDRNKRSDTAAPFSMQSHPGDDSAYLGIRWLNSSPFFWDVDVYSDFFDFFLNVPKAPNPSVLDRYDAQSAIHVGPKTHSVNRIN